MIWRLRLGELDYGVLYCLKLVLQVHNAIPNCYMHRGLKTVSQSMPNAYPRVQACWFGVAAGGEEGERYLFLE